MTNRNYRVVIHVLPENQPCRTFASEAMSSFAKADELLTWLTETDRASGGHVEERVDGIGWVWCSFQDERESI